MVHIRALGLLHLDIVRERLEREYGLSLITTAPTVVYKVTTRNGNTMFIDNPVRLPAEIEVERIEEPYILATIHVPQEYLGNILGLCEEKRGSQKEIRYLGPKRVMVLYELPLNEIVFDFYDRLKSVSRGYASMDYEICGIRPSNLVKLDIRINGNPVDALGLGLTLFYILSFKPSTRQGMPPGESPLVLPASFFSCPLFASLKAYASV